MKFLADSSLGRLSKWLRILGYDTVYWRGEMPTGSFCAKRRRRAGPS